VLSHRDEDIRSHIEAQLGGITIVALPLLAITTLHASDFAISLITVANYLAIVVLGLPAGVLVRRLPLRRVQLSMGRPVVGPVRRSHGRLGRRRRRSGRAVVQPVS
jgi:MFS family permease